MTNQQLKLNIELEVNEAIAAKFPEADDVIVDFDPETQALTTNGLEKYLLMYGGKYRLKVRHEFLKIIIKHVKEFNLLNNK